MAYGQDRPSVAYGVVAVALTAVLVYFGTGLFPRWPLMWFAPLPVLLFAARSSRRWAAAAAFLAWFLGGLNLFHYFNSLLRMPIGVQLMIYGGPALLFMLAVLLFRALVRRQAWWTAIVAFPAVWVALEYLSSLTSPHGTAGNISYSQLNFLPLLQLASVTGPWGVSFVLMLLSSTIAVAVELQRASGRKALQFLGGGCAVVALTLLFGAIRLSGSTPGPRVKVGLVASDLRENADVAGEGAEADRLFQAYEAPVQELAARGAQVVVLPEKLAVVVDSEREKTDTFFQSLADRTSVMIVLGMVYVSPPVKYNRARVYTPHEPFQSYDKHHMLPPFESPLKPGTTMLFIPKSSATWGVEICKDMDFTALSREYGRAGAGLMLVPAWDFIADRFLHGHMAVMRGVEDGFSIVRAAKQGYLTVSDDRGRILAEVRSDAAPFATLLADVPAQHEPTIYARLGDWFAWLACALTVVSVAKLFRKSPVAS